MSERMNGSHEQVWVKVNAPVDSGVVRLVDALSRFPGLRTLESCEGPPAWVVFEVGLGEWRDLAELVLGYLGPAVAGELGDLATFTICVTEVGHAQGELTVRQGAMDNTVSLLHHLAAQAAATGAARPPEVRHDRRWVVKPGRVLVDWHASTLLSSTSGVVHERPRPESNRDFSPCQGERLCPFAHGASTFSEPPSHRSCLPPIRNGDPG